MVDIVPHTEWEDPRLPVTGPPPVKYRVTLIPAHYTAAVVIPDGNPSPTEANRTVVAAYLRAIQRDYKNRRPTGYSIGYNFAIDQSGQAWECRGLGIKCAANVKRNDETMAILCIVNGADPMNDKMVATFKALVAHIEGHFGRKMTVVGHRDIGSTACPGDGIYAQVKAGLLTPGDTPTPVPPTKPIPTPRPPIPGDDTMTIRIFESQTDPKEFNAMFFAECDSRDRSIELQWSGYGDDPRVKERIKIMTENFGPPLPLLLAGVKNNRLHPKHKPSDIRDSAKQGGWSDLDFAP